MTHAINTSPGVDGLPGEYYKTLINELTVLCRVSNYALTEGHPPESWSDAVISVIHKENKDPTLCSNLLGSFALLLKSRVPDIQAHLAADINLCQSCI